MHYLIHLVIDLLTKLPEALTMYAVVHFIAKRGQETEQGLEKLVRRHIIHKHKGRFKNCDRCKTIQVRQQEQGLAQLAAVDSVQ